MISSLFLKKWNLFNCFSPIIKQNVSFFFFMEKWIHLSWSLQIVSSQKTIKHFGLLGGGGLIIPTVHFKDVCHTHSHSPCSSFQNVHFLHFRHYQSGYSMFQPHKHFFATKWKWCHPLELCQMWQPSLICQWRQNMYV